MNKTLIEFEKTIQAIEKLKDVPHTELLEPIKRGKWSVREIIGHLYYWDKYIIEEMVPRMTDGAVLSPFPDHDQHNEKAISHIKDQSVDSVIDTFIETRKELLDCMSKLEPDTKFTIGNEVGQFERERFLQIFVEHDIHHLQQIDEKLNKL